MSSNSNGTRDTNLVSAVRKAIAQNDSTRIWKDAIQVDARGGTIILSGVVRSQSMKELSGQFAARVKGVTQVQNNLLADTDVEIAVAQALASDSRTGSGFPGILVGTVFGVVYLKGSVASPEIKNAATQVANKVFGVRRVSNELLAPMPVKPAPATKPAAASAPE